MKLAILGATGPTGQHVVEQALARGHEVVAVVRNPDKITANHPNLQVAKADIFNADQLFVHITSCDAVVSCLGPSEYTFFGQITIYSESAKTITAAMERARISRFVFASSWLVEEKESHPWYARLIFRPMLRRYSEDIGRMETFLRHECPNIEYTSVRLPVLTNGKLDPREGLMQADVDYSTIMNLLKMPRANVAQCMLDVVEHRLYPRRCIVVGLPK